MSQYEIPRRRVRSSASQAVAVATTSFDDIVDHENLLAVFQDLRANGGRAAGIDGLTYDDYGPREAAAAFRDLTRKIKDGTYRAKPFRTVLIPKRSLSADQSGERREISIATVMDRCVSTAVHRALTPIFDTMFLDSIYGFRSGRGVWQLLLHIEREIQRTGRTILYQDDVRHAFPSVRLDRLFRHLSNHVSDPRLLSLIERMFRFERGTREIGLPQGDAFAPTGLNVELHYDLDILVRQEPNLGQVRYADNLIGPAGSPSEAERSLDISERHLAAAGLQLKRVPDRITDLTKRTASVLGYAVRWDGSQLRISIPDQSWEYLRGKLEDGLRSPTPHHTARLATRGWIMAYGPAFGPAAAHYEASRIVNLCTKFHLEAPTRHEIHQWIEEAKERWVRVRGGGVGCASPRPPFFDDADQLLVDELVDNPLSIPPWIGKDV
ncbi:reverse transcriptase domain-containing protein [Planctomyces sp. SH-PL14]|uniref:reverse transcriptase domain-containing protein n=1 Tax=Planctomyces sp. SH-PL14 TaxID=1632864 RepID=UPI00078B469A|nr:reverse transcriptase domain-containing protein [Planctomyces sp. SH-PL14]AMV19197.1 Group II intron-encoded protein LtrA [Planctomyces sp. SH-PL14]